MYPNLRKNRRSRRSFRALAAAIPFSIEQLESRVLLSAGGGVESNAGLTPAASNPIANGMYTLTNGASSLFLDDPQNTNATGTQVTQNTSDSLNPNYGSDEQWQFTYNGAGYYTIENFGAKLYLEDPGSATASGTALELGSSDGGTDQLWSVTASGNSYVITNEASGLVIDDPGSSTTVQGDIDLATATAGANQNWAFVSSPPVADGIYTIENNKSGLLLDDPSSSQTSGLQLIQNSTVSNIYEFGGGNDERWSIAFNGAGFYTIENLASGLFLTDPGASTKAGVALEQAAADGTTDQLWALFISGSSFIIKNDASGLVADDTGNSTSAGTGMDIYTANGGSNQNWSFEPAIPISVGMYTLTNGASKLYLDDPGSSTASGIQMVQNPSDGGRDEDWQFNYNGVGYYTIQNVLSGLYLDDPGGSTTPGVSLEQATADNANDQLWLPIGSGSSFILKNLATGLVVDDFNSSTTAGAGMDLRASTGGTNQAWALSTVSPVYVASNGELGYVPDASGDTIPNFSLVGYETGDVPLPDTTGGVQVPVMETVNPGSGDMTTTIQNAINAVEAMPLQSNGFRGAVLLTAGNYQISGTLSITASGVLLEGQGNNSSTGTRLEATGTVQRTLVNITGSGGYSTVSNTTHSITDNYVPVGATSFDVNSTSNLAVGDTVIVSRPSTQAWIDAIDMNELNDPWSPGQGAQTWYRVITAINGDNITINSPLTNSLSQQYGGGTISEYTWSKLISNDGMENIYAYSDSTGDTDLNHATGVLNANDNENMFIYNVTSNGFASNHFVIGNTLYSTLDDITAENTSINTDPPSGVLTSGQFILVENSTFINSYHAIAVLNGDGPNVYYNINASGTGAQVGPHLDWTTGDLFDNVTISGTQLGAFNRGNDGSGQGWGGANYVFWNDANNTQLDNFNPPTAQQWVFGGSSEETIDTEDGSEANVPADYIDLGQVVAPQSLYIAQLLDRLTPTVQTAAAANPSSVTATTTSLSVLGADAAGESTLDYTWSASNVPAGAAAPVFSSTNGTNDGNDLTATFSKAGTYTFLVTIQYPGGFSVTSSVNVTVQAAIHSVSVSPSSVTLGFGGTEQFTATAYDQFGIALATQPNFGWSVQAGGAGGTISSSGLYTAPATGGTDIVTAMSGTASGTATVGVSATPLGVFTAAADIGAPALAGSSGYNAGSETYTINGAGNGISGTSDQFQFCYTASTGDTSITAEVVSDTDTSSTAQNGLMIRNSLSADSANILLYLTPANGIKLQSRGTDGGEASLNATTSDLSAPYWLRLVRVGNAFAAYTSRNGGTWNLLGLINMTMNGTVYIGLAVSSDTTSAMNTATFQNVSIGPAISTWTGEGDGTNWSNLSNWAPNAVPGQSDDVSIPSGVAGLIVSGGTFAAAALNSSSPITISGGTLALFGSSVIGGALTIQNGGTLDLTNSTLTINYAGGSDPISAIQSYISNGYNNGSWTGSGIVSSTVASENANQSELIYAIGYADGADGIVSGLSSGQIEIMPTLSGDATLQGSVSFGDFQLLSQYFGQAGGWDEGNFTYGSTVDFGDFQLVSQNFGQTASLAAESENTLAVAPTIGRASSALPPTPPEIDSSIEVASTGDAIDGILNINNNGILTFSDRPLID
jgi:regulation of enolase protein 1 (concanavalin A-like superfamily)